jgi:hypothetical protein
MTSPFLWGAGSSNNGLISSALTPMATELNSLATATAVISSAGGLSTNGVFNDTLTGQAILGDVYLKLGAIGTALSAGANVAGWFLISPDGGTTYENYVTGVALARAPDFIIPLPATTITSGWVYKSVGVHKVIVPATYFKVVLQNNSGQTFASSGNTLTLASPTINY